MGDHYAPVAQIGRGAWLRTRRLGVRIFPRGTNMESAAKWLATGPENQGFRKDRGSIPPLSANREGAGVGSPNGLLNRRGLQASCGFDSHTFRKKVKSVSVSSCASLRSSR